MQSLVARLPQLADDFVCFRIMGLIKGLQGLQGLGFCDWCLGLNRSSFDLSSRYRPKSLIFCSQLVTRRLFAWP